MSQQEESVDSQQENPGLFNKGVPTGEPNETLPATGSTGIKEPGSTATTQSHPSRRRTTKERTLLPIVPSMSSPTSSSRRSSQPATPTSSRNNTVTNSDYESATYVPVGLHSPSNLPPVPYDTPTSPWKPKQPRKHSKDIEAAKLGALMTRMDRLEVAVGKYVDERGKEALKKSVVPGLDAKKDSAEGSNNGKK